MLRRTSYLSALWLVSLAGTSHADLRGEFGVAIGAHIFSDENGLGVPDAPSVTSQENSVLMGLRLGGYIGEIFGLEAEVGAVPSRVRAEPSSTLNLYYRLNAVLQFRAVDRENILVPFILGGAGGMSLVAKPGATMVSEETVGEFHFGAGVKLRSQWGWGLRGDVLVLFPPSSQGGYATDFEVTVSVYKEWGGGTVKEEPAARSTTPFVFENAPVDTPTVAADTANRDSDNDGLIDTADTCPQSPEDKDSFNDADGCPDLDNDNDGVTDALDQCPSTAETVNGFTDTDGCPDTLPAKVQQFSGKVEGINFRTGSADLLATSNKTLDEVVSVLNEYPQLKVEVGGHTDDVPLTANRAAKYQTNDELSQARAEAVKAYFVKKGIATDRITAKGYGSTVPVESPTGLTGAKLASARTKNRRVEFKMQ